MPVFESSNGTLITCQQGFVIENESELDDWLCNIKQVDMKEVREYMKNQQIPEWETIDDFDILDVGVWMKDGSYIPPDQSWREEVFHNVNLKK